MLVNNSIPNEEPYINVGIVLPEDSCKILHLKIPNFPGYHLNYHDRNHRLNSGSHLQIKIEQQEMVLKINESTSHTGNQFSIRSDSDDPRLIPGQGLIVRDVVAGRSFHWKKLITVNLPGNLEIIKHGNSIILINILPLEQYVMCVATSEMGSACPDSLIESQTIAARSWILANVEQKHRHLKMDVCNDDCCQRYQGSTYLSEQSVKGALSTSGQVIMYEAEICDARYSKSCGGMMERFETIWEGKGHPYLQCLPDSMEEPAELVGSLNEEKYAKKWIRSIPQTFCSSITVEENELYRYLGSVDEKGHYFRWKIELTQEMLTDAINQQHHLDAQWILDLIPVSRGGSGRLNKLKILYITSNKKKQSYILSSEYDIRRSLDKKFLYSSAFIIEMRAGTADIPEKFTLIGAGWGHGVGFCQIGALGMSLNKYETAEILKHYYPESRLVRLY